MPIILKVELEAAGYKKKPEDFAEAISKVFHEAFDGWSTDDVLFRPRDALKLADLVRLSIKNQNIADDTILRTMGNYRKRGSKLFNKK